MSEDSRRRGLLDTSVVIDLDQLNSDLLPARPAISAITLAELAAGPHSAVNADERARRQYLLQSVEGWFEPIPVDAAVARAFGRVYNSILAAGRKARGRRSLDLLIAATALAHELPIYTRNARDLEPAASLIEIVSV